MLGRVGAHLEPKHAVGTAYLNIAQQDVAVVHAFAAKSEAAVHNTVLAMLDEDVEAGAVVGIRVGPCALAALDGHGIVVDRHVTPVDEHIVAGVNIDGIAAGSLQPLGGRKDVAAEKAHVVAAVEVVGPEGAVGKGDVLHGHIVAVRQVHEPRALLVLVGALGIPLAPEPEGLPIMAPVAVDGALSGNGEAIDGIGIDQCGKIGTGLALDAGGENGKVGNVLAALEFAALFDEKMGALTEEE